jgi:acyl carrier protein
VSVSPTAQALKDILVKIKSDPALFTRVAEDAHLLDEVGLDSIEILQFMLEIEAALAVQLDFDKLQYSSLRSIHTLAAFLDAQRA